MSFSGTQPAKKVQILSAPKEGVRVRFNNPTRVFESWQHEQGEVKSVLRVKLRAHTFCESGKTCFARGFEHSFHLTRKSIPSDLRRKFS